MHAELNAAGMCVRTITVSNSHHNLNSQNKGRLNKFADDAELGEKRNQNRQFRNWNTS